MNRVIRCNKLEHNTWAELGVVVEGVVSKLERLHNSNSNQWNKVIKVYHEKKLLQDFKGFMWKEIGE